MDEITLDRPLDMHVHFRQGPMLRHVVPLSAATFAGAMAMPNTDPPLDAYDRLHDYMVEVLRGARYVPFRPYGTLYFRPDYTYQELAAAKPYVTAIKFYPRNLTTNSQHGCDPDDPGVEEVLEIMQTLHIPLSVHPESFGYHEDREELFGKFIESWACYFPRLKIIMEHVSDRRSLPLLRHSNVFATMTPQHLLITGDDWVGPPLRPHLYCMPVAKRPEDRAALLRAATVDFPSKVMLGTDSAPHPAEKKESACGCAGVFTAPIALQLYAQAFDRAGHLDKLQAFASDNARRIYGVDPPAKSVTLARKPFVVPDTYGAVVPMWAGETLDWSVAP